MIEMRYRVPRTFVPTHEPGERWYDDHWFVNLPSLLGLTLKGYFLMKNQEFKFPVYVCNAVEHKARLIRFSLDLRKDAIDEIFKHLSLEHVMSENEIAAFLDGQDNWQVYSSANDWCISPWRFHHSGIDLN